MKVGCYISESNQRELFQVSKKKAAELMLDQLRQVGAMVVSIRFYFFIFLFYHFEFLMVVEKVFQVDLMKKMI